MASATTGSALRARRRNTRGHGDTRLVRLTGTALAVVFAAVGVVFLLVPGRVLELFNAIGDVAGMPASPTAAFTLFLGLAVAYMYVVTLLAAQMARHPRVKTYPWLLVQAKAVSAVVCLALFAAQDHYLVYLANAVVDGTIAVVVWAVAVRGRPDDVPAATGDAVTSVRPGQLRRTAS
jgi:hypothetical protein